jgi:hypothetical protein
MKRDLTSRQGFPFTWQFASSTLIKQSSESQVGWPAGGSLEVEMGVTIVVLVMTVEEAVKLVT